MQAQPMLTFGFLTQRENTTILLRRALSENIEKNLESLHPWKKTEIRRFLRFLAKVQAKHPSATISIVDRTPGTLKLMVWHKTECPSGASPMLSVPICGSLVRAMQSLSLLPRLGAN